MRDLEPQLARIKGRWMTGGSAREHSPPEWHDLVGTDEDADLRLLALVGQLSLVGFRPSPATALAVRQVLPRLSHPNLPECLRPRFRRLLQVTKSDAGRTAAVLNLIAGRGYSVHPADWMPAAGSSQMDIPELYAPWADWRASQDAPMVDDELTVDNWDEWPRAQRNAELRALRHRVPELARELIEAKAAAEKAEQRLRLLEIMGVGLSDEDLPFLESLDRDRSEKVKALAKALTARLGRSTDPEDAVAELADFLEVSKAGFLSRQAQLSPKKVKTGAQQARRSELFAIVSLAGLANALRITERDVVTTWHDKQGTATDDFVQMVARTGSEAVQLSCLERLLDNGLDFLFTVTPLTARLGAEARNRAVAMIMAQDDESFLATALAAGHELGHISLDTIEATRAFKALHAGVKVVAKADGDRHGQQDSVSEGLFHLALLADQAAARTVIQRFTEAGLTVADPQLDLLNLNAALHRRSSS